MLSSPSSGKPACAVVRLAPCSLSRVRDWAAYIEDHRKEALDSLKSEGVTLESVFLDSRDDGDYLIYYMRSNSQEEAEQAARNSTLAIDEHHKAFKKSTWVSAKRLELLVDLERG